ncbi:MAG: GYD domain-containing protein [Actinomycetota bacterium]
MPRYASLFSYTPESWARMMANPGDRAAAVRKVTEALGGKLEAFYWMFGEYDGLAIFDMPDSSTQAAVAIGVASTGVLKSLVTHELIGMEDTTAILEKARAAVGAYAPPGTPT